MTRLQVLASSSAILFLAVLGVYADNQVLTASTTLAAGQPAFPTGSIALTSVSDALSQPQSSPLMTKNTFAVGNNVVITKSNIIIRKEADGSDSDSKKPPTAAAIPSLARAIEGVVARSSADNINASCDAVLDMLGMAPSSSSFDAIRSQVMALFQLRGDRPALRKRVVTLLNTASELSEAEERSYMGKGDGDDDGDDQDKDRGGKDDDAKQQQQGQLIGYRTLFRWSAGTQSYYGWRYPLRYWVVYGASRFGSSCGLGRVIGSFFYC